MSKRINIRDLLNDSESCTVLPRSPPELAPSPVLPTCCDHSTSPTFTVPDTAVDQPASSRSPDMNSAPAAPQEQTLSSVDQIVPHPPSPSPSPLESHQSHPESSWDFRLLNQSSALPSFSQSASSLANSALPLDLPPPCPLETTPVLTPGMPDRPHSSWLPYAEARQRYFQSAPPSALDSIVPDAGPGPPSSSSAIFPLSFQSSLVDPRKQQQVPPSPGPWVHHPDASNFRSTPYPSFHSKPHGAGPSSDRWAPFSPPPPPLPPSPTSREAEHQRQEPPSGPQLIFEDHSFHKGQPPKTTRQVIGTKFRDGLIFNCPDCGPRYEPRSHADDPTHHQACCELCGKSRNMMYARDIHFCTCTDRKCRCKKSQGTGRCKRGICDVCLFEKAFSIHQWLSRTEPEIPEAVTCIPGQFSFKSYMLRHFGEELRSLPDLWDLSDSSFDWLLCCECLSQRLGRLYSDVCPCAYHLRLRGGAHAAPPTPRPPPRHLKPPSTTSRR